MKSLKTLKLRCIQYAMKNLDFIPSTVESFTFEFNHNAPVAVEDTRVAVRQLIQDRDKEEDNNLKHLTLRFKAMQGIDMDFINRDHLNDNPTTTLESLKLEGSSLEMLNITDLGLNIEKFYNLQVIDFNINDEVSPNGFSEKIITQYFQSWLMMDNLPPKLHTFSFKC